MDITSNIHHNSNSNIKLTTERLGELGGARTSAAWALRIALPCISQPERLIICGVLLRQNHGIGLVLLALDLPLRVNLRPAHTNR